MLIKQHSTYLIINNTFQRTTPNISCLAIFEQVGFIERLLNLGGKDVIIAECKTVKDKDYNKFTAVSRQLKSYEALCKKNGYHVNQVIIVSNDFTEDFIGECEYEYDIGISLLTSSDLLKIYEGLKNSHLGELPVRLITKGGALNGDRIVKALNR